MPCYSVITNSVEFKAENVKFLEKAIKKAGYTKKIVGDLVGICDKYGWNIATINMKTQKISSTMNQKSLNDMSNSIKRAYSMEIINEVAKQNKWIAKNMGQNKMQLQRF